MATVYQLFLLCAFTACAPAGSGGSARPSSTPAKQVQSTAPRSSQPSIVDAPGQSGSRPAPSPAAVYEPEAYHPSTPLGLDAARDVLSSLSTAPKAECEQWRQPLSTRCEVGERDALSALIDSLDNKASFNSPEAQSQWLFVLEGCATLPVGLVRWMRMRTLPQCSVELGESALANGTQTIAAPLMNFITGEVLGSKCQRLIQPMPVYDGRNFDPRRFELWAQTKVRPWQTRMRQALNVCHSAVEKLPAGDHGRAAGELGHALARLRLITGHRSARMPTTLAQDYEGRTQYLTALDTLAESDWQALTALLQATIAHGVVAGEYHAYVTPLSELLAGHSPLDALSLPALDGPRSLESERAIASLPVAAARLLFNAEQWSTETSLKAIVSRGLPLEVRAEVGRRLVTLSPQAPERQRQHALLATGLVRLGLVLQSRTAIERAAYELSFATYDVNARWLSAVVRALLTPGSDRVVFPQRGQSRLSPPLDRSGFTADLMAMAERDESYATLGLDHAVLGRWNHQDALGSISDLRAILIAADKEGVPERVRNCLHSEFDDTWHSWLESSNPNAVRRACKPYPWLHR